MIKKMIAVLSAITIMGSYTAVNTSQYWLVSSYATGETAEQAESCGAMISIVAPNDKLPKGITAKLVEVKGEERTVLSEWDAAESGIRVIKDLKYRDDISYKIIIENVPRLFYLPEETDIVLKNDKYMDKIVICGFRFKKYPGFFVSISNGTELHFSRRFVKITSDTLYMTDVYDKKYIEEAYITDDNGYRYINAFSDRSSCFIVPDGHYTAFVKPAEGYSFVKKNTEAAIYASKDFTTPNYFDQDFSNGIEFNVKNGISDTETKFYITASPTPENKCSASISIIDEATGEFLENCGLKLTSEFTLDKYDIIWNTTADGPEEFDDLRALSDDYTVSVINLLPFYKVKDDEYKFSFENYGEHKDIVIKAKRTMSEEEAAALQKVEIPVEDPVPIDNEHCAVTVAIYDMKTYLPSPEASVSLIKRIGNDRESETTLATWDASQEPVKTITDIEFDENARYFVKFDNPFDRNLNYNNVGKIELYFNKGGDVNKIAFPLYESYMYGNVQADCVIGIQNESMRSLQSISYLDGVFPLESYGVYDDNGYRYAFASCLSSDQLGNGALPDGEYTLRIVPKEGYRVLHMNSENALLDITRKKFNDKFMEMNYSNGINGLRFKVENGISTSKNTIIIEEAPTPEKSFSASISVVDSETEEIIKDVDLKFESDKNSSYPYYWNTSDTPVQTFDNLLYPKSSYYVYVLSAPEGYSYNSDAHKLPLSEYGENKEFIIKLDKLPLLGDANCDGGVDMADVVLIMQSLANPNKYGLNGTDNNHIKDKGLKNGDVDTKIKGITSNDALCIQEFLLGKIKSLETIN